MKLLIFGLLTLSLNLFAMDFSKSSEHFVECKTGYSSITVLSKDFYISNNSTKYENCPSDGIVEHSTGDKSVVRLARFKANICYYDGPNIWITCKPL
jgi:outer membrane lipoprotein-sorting protein